MPTTGFPHVLVVEADASQRRRLCDRLEADGFQVLGSSSGGEGLEQIRRHQVGVAVIDARLPDGSIAQLLEQIRRCDDQIRVIIYSQAAGCDSTKEAFNGDAFAEVEKASNPSELLRHVRRACCEQVDRYARNLEQAVAQRTEELARSNYELENFAFVVAHDLRSPLLTIAGYSQILQEDYQEDLEPSAREYLGEIVHAVERMDRMIEDLLKYSRAGRSQQPAEPVDVQSVLTHAVANLEAAIRQQRATIRSGWMPTVLGDRAQLVRLFQNLIDNAVKFRRSPDPMVGVEARSSNAHWEFTVEDNGIGIAERDFGRLFQVFQRLQSHDYPGTGIGLAICKKIVERHGGRIWLESVVDRGTKFSFTLPKAEDSSTRPAHP